MDGTDIGIKLYQLTTAAATPPASHDCIGPGEYSPVHKVEWGQGKGRSCRGGTRGFWAEEELRVENRCTSAFRYSRDSPSWWSSTWKRVYGHKGARWEWSNTGLTCGQKNFSRNRKKISILSLTRRFGQSDRVPEQGLPFAGIRISSDSTWLQSERKPPTPRSSPRTAANPLGWFTSHDLTFNDEMESNPAQIQNAAASSTPRAPAHILRTGNLVVGTRPNRVLVCMRRIFATNLGQRFTQDDQA